MKNFPLCLDPRYPGKMRSPGFTVSKNNKVVTAVGEDFWKNIIGKDGIPAHEDGDYAHATKIVHTDANAHVMTGFTTLPTFASDAGCAFPGYNLMTGDALDLHNGCRYGANAENPTPYLSIPTIKQTKEVINVLQIRNKGASKNVRWIVDGTAGPWVECAAQLTGERIYPMASLYTNDDAIESVSLDELEIRTGDAKTLIEDYIKASSANGRAPPARNPRASVPAYIKQLAAAINAMHAQQQQQPQRKYDDDDDNADDDIGAAAAASFDNAKNNNHASKGTKGTNRAHHTSNSTAVGEENLTDVGGNNSRHHHQQRWQQQQKSGISTTSSVRDWMRNLNDDDGASSVSQTRFSSTSTSESRNAKRKDFAETVKNCFAGDKRACVADMPTLELADVMFAFNFPQPTIDAILGKQYNGATFVMRTFHFDNETINKYKIDALMLELFTENRLQLLR